MKLQNDKMLGKISTNHKINRGYLKNELGLILSETFPMFCNYLLSMINLLHMIPYIPPLESLTLSIFSLERVK